MTTDLVTEKDVTLNFMSLARPTELGQTLKSAGDHPVHRQVILNGADLESYRAVIDEYESSVSFLVNHKNLGWAGAVNQAIATSPTRYVVISGDDLTYDSDWLEKLLAGLNQPDRPRQFSLSYPTPFSCICIDKDLVRLQGWFDQNFTRVYFDDTDWALRTLEQVGQGPDPQYAIDVLPKLDVVQRFPHANAPWNWIPNKLYFYTKWKLVREPSERSFYVEPDIIVERRLSDPVWTHLEPIRNLYAAGDYSSRPFVYDPPAVPQRILTTMTANRAVHSSVRALRPLYRRVKGRRRTAEPSH